MGFGAPTYYDLKFDHLKEATNGNHSQLGAYYDGTTLHFLNVAPNSGKSIDLRITVTDITSRYAYLGSFPNYNNAPGQPEGDLGILYEFNSHSYGAGGITYNLEFFEGGDLFETPFVVPDFRLLVYDVDGESGQSESVRVSLDDGFAGYLISSTTSMRVTDEGSSFLFTGPGVDYAEENTDSAFVLYFENTSSVSLQLLANTTSGWRRNAVFAALDGDLSLVRDDPAWDDSVSITPEPGSSLLVVSAFTLMLLLRRRAA